MTEEQADEIIHLLQRSNELLEALSERMEENHRDMDSKLHDIQLEVVEAVSKAGHEIVMELISK